MIGERIWARMMRNVAEPDNAQACWVWQLRVDRVGYGLINVYVPGLGRNATLKAHIVAWLIANVEDALDSADDLYLAYKELTISRLQLDHSCVTSCCISPDHLQPVSHIENQQLRDARRKAKTQSSFLIYA